MKRINTRTSLTAIAAVLFTLAGTAQTHSSLREFMKTYPLKPVRSYTFFGTEKSVHQVWGSVCRYDKPIVQAYGSIDVWFNPAGYCVPAQLVAPRLAAWLWKKKPTPNAQGSAFKTRGVVLNPKDLTLDWPERAARAGLTTIALHNKPGSKEEKTAFDRCLAKCAELGLDVEYEMHYRGALLPRELFGKEPDLFRMNEKGERTNDFNFCVHSERALEIAASNAVKVAQDLKPTTGRYYFWGDDGREGCRCPKCRDYSASEQTLILENYLVKTLRKEVDPNAMVSHLAYVHTVPAPRKVKPEPGVFLEFAPSTRRMDIPFVKQKEMRWNPTLEALEENLKIFPVETAQILEYWLDVSMITRQYYADQVVKRPYIARQLPWYPDIVKIDAQTYARLGIRHITTFVCSVDANYVARYGEPTFIQEYGDILLSTPPAKTYMVARILRNQIRSDSR